MVGGAVLRAERTFTLYMVGLVDDLFRALASRGGVHGSRLKIPR